MHNRLPESGQRWAENRRSAAPWLSLWESQVGADVLGGPRQPRYNRAGYREMAGWRLALLDRDLTREFGEK